MKARELLARAQAERGELTALLASLIAVDSRSGSEGALALRLHEQHRRLGFSSSLWPVDDRFNVSASIGEGPDTILFAGHLDTVPADEDAWSSPPLSPRIEGDRIHGLGASDMKASIAAATWALRLLADDPPPGRVAVVWTVDEETTGEGTRRFVEQAVASGFLRPSRTVCVVTEPSGLREVVLGSRGAVFPFLRVVGRASHGSRPHLALSPIEAAGDILREAARIERRWLAEHAAPPLPAPSLTPTVVHSGEEATPNRVPAAALVGFDARVTPSLSADGFRAVAESFVPLLERLRARGCEAELELRRPRPGHVLPETHPLARCALAVLRDDLGIRDASFGYTRAANDACFFQEAGIDTLNKWGPGDPQEAHTADESASLERTVQAAAAYALLAHRWLGERRGSR